LRALYALCKQALRSAYETSSMLASSLLIKVICSKQANPQL